MWLVLTFGRIFSAWDHQTFPPHKKQFLLARNNSCHATPRRWPAGNCFFWRGYTVYLKPVFYFQSEKTSYTRVFLRWQTTYRNRPTSVRLSPATPRRRPAGNCFFLGGYTDYLKPVFYFRSEKTSYKSVFLRWQTTCRNHPGPARSCISLV